MQDSGSLAVFKVTARDQGQYKGHSGAFITYCNISCLFPFSAKLLPVGYGIKKLQINAVVEDDKVSTDDLEEKITAFEDYVSNLRSCMCGYKANEKGSN